MSYTQTMAFAAVKSWVLNTLTVLVSILVTFAIAEAMLRTLYPKYEYAAEARFQADSLRITTRPPNARRIVHHPDTRAPHLVIYNNHGMRQHRNFGLHDLKGAINVGFFGDSYMENMGLPGPHSFTEPLDYLLNRSGQDFNVLNFGQSGYGTDQSFLAYKYADLSATLDQVFYVFCINDIRNIYENDLFHLNQSGELQRNPALATPWWIKLVSRLHLTYLLQDGYNRLRPRKNDWEGLDARILQEKHADKRVRKRMRSDRAKSVGSSIREGTDNADVTRSLAVFQALLEEWQTLAAANGASFYVVLLPTGNGSLVEDYIPDNIPVIDLYARFAATTPDYDYKDWHFQNDRHWAEAANRLAAVTLYRDIAAQAELDALPASLIDESLYTYYSAFDLGWMPAAQAEPVNRDDDELKRIADRYAELDEAPAPVD